MRRLGFEYEKSPHSVLCLNTWSLAGATVWEVMGPLGLGPSLQKGLSVGES